MSGIETLVVGAIKSYASKKVMDFTSKGIWSKIFPEKTWNYFLVKEIHKTINEYEKLYPYERVRGDKFPFYSSQILFEKLTSYVLFGNENIESIPSDFIENPNIIVPTANELSAFYDLFYNNIKNSKLLSEKFIDKNYKEQIFKVSGSLTNITEKITLIDSKIDRLQNTLDKRNLTNPILIETLKVQVENQLKVQLNSGKYLREIFIETGDQKDHLRYLCDPIFFSEKIFDEISILDFRILNEYLIKAQKSQFTLQDILIKDDIGNHSQTATVLNNLFDSLNKKKEWLSNNVQGNFSYRFKHKIDNSINNIRFLKSKVALITEMAGQGKTNFLCDFVENFLNKRKIPNVFLTGTELKSNDIRNSILRRIFPDRNDLDFLELLENVKETCDSNKTFFVIVIDGINENGNAKELSSTLESFISDVLKYDFIRVVISCRKEYYDDNFSNLEKSVFKDEMIVIENLFKRNLDNYLKEKLFSGYFKHFNIEYERINKQIKKQLSSNFLLLRIFCESFENQKLGVIDNIYKEELFERYFINKTEEINIRLITNNEFKIKGKIDIKNFISKIIEIMIAKKAYVNIPLDAIVEEPSSREMFVRFLDENILIKRDLDVESGIFTSSEVVNFTFDEFRDFLISRYLIEVLYKSSVDDFVRFLNEELTDVSPLMEGCSTFLFYKSRKSEDDVLRKIIRNQTWFKDVFSRSIFNVKDEDVKSDDITFLQEIMLETKINKKNIIVNLINRRNDIIYKNLNIDLLFKMIREMEDESFQENFANSFGNSNERYWKLCVEDILNILRPKINDNELVGHQHKFFELLIYLFTCKESYLVKKLYERYFFKNNDVGKQQLLQALNSNCGILKNEINIFIQNYEISL